MNKYDALCYLILVGKAFGFLSLSQSKHRLILKDTEQPEDNEADWRAFRARLVRNEDASSQQSSTNNIGGAGWTYEQPVVERGSLLIHNPRNDAHQEMYSLTRQYLFKSVLLVVEHHPEETICLVLNRKTDLNLKDDVYEASRIYYGGDQCSIHGDTPKFYCLHSLTSNEAREASTLIMSGLYFTSIREARRLVQMGVATSLDFIDICGYVSFTPAGHQLDLQQQDWRCVSVDSTALYEALEQESTWQHLLTSIHAVDDPNSMQVDSCFASTQSFNARMLREWKRTHLFFDKAPPFLRPDNDESNGPTTASLQEGDVVRAESLSYLFGNQAHHKAIMLITQEDAEFTVGILLNHPTSHVVSLDGNEIPIRYGGTYGMLDVDEEMPPFVIHRLGNKIVPGSEMIGKSRQHFFKTCLDCAKAAIARGKAHPDDFMIVKGMEVWQKDSAGSNFLLEEYQYGRWERILPNKLDVMWKYLLAQEQLTIHSLERNIGLAYYAWRLAGEFDHDGDYEGDSLTMAVLGRDALKVWVAAMFLEE